MGPCAAGALLLPPTNHWDFTHKRNRAERVQTVNAGDGSGVLQAGLGNSGHDVAQWLGLAQQFVEADAVERDREGPFRLADGWKHHVVEQRLTVRGRRIASLLDGAGSAQD